MNTPMNCALLMGVPRSGTTIVARVLGRHSRIKSVIEPYQSRRHEGYAVTDWQQFLGEVEGLSNEQSLFVKETTTRAQNIQFSLNLLKNSESAGVRPLVFLAVRSPVESYLSQVELAERTIKDKPDFKYGENTVDTFSKVTLRGLHTFLVGARRYDKRVVMYRRFLREPAEETRRLMAAFPYFHEATQLDLSSKDMPTGGDPSAWTATEVSEKGASNRTDQVARFATDFKHVKSASSLLKLHHEISSWSNDTYSDDEWVWAKLEQLVRMEMVRNAMPIY